jgi:hypothetical protein
VGLPAVLGRHAHPAQGFVDRIFTAGFAYEGRPGTDSWTPLLRNKSADILVVVDSLPWYNRFGVTRAATRQLKEAVLEPCGISPVRGFTFGPMRTATATRQSRWLEQVVKLATTGLGLPAAASRDPAEGPLPRVLRSPFLDTDWPAADSGNPFPPPEKKPVRHELSG